MAQDYTEIVTHNYKRVSGHRTPGYYDDCLDWQQWREAFEGGRLFRDKYLKQYSDRETVLEFTRRKELTPIPTYAKRGISRIRNNLAQRFVDVIRKDGSKKYQTAIAGNGRGVDGKGSSMNFFIQSQILDELLVMGKVGVFIDSARLDSGTLAEAADAMPYMYRYTIEQICDLHPAPYGSKSEYDAVLLLDVNEDRDRTTGVTKTVKRYRYLWIDEATQKVRAQYISMKGEADGPEIVTDLDAIPFVLYDINGSLMKDVASYQIALLNLASADTSYAIDSNFSFLTKQDRGNPFDVQSFSGPQAAPASGEDATTANVPVPTGPRKGMRYDPLMERPGFIAPPTDPARLSGEMRKEYAKEIFDLIDAAVSEKGDDENSPLESGLAFIGGQLQGAEVKIAKHWAAYEQADEKRREYPTIKYPEEWRLRPLTERLEECAAGTKLIWSFPGEETKNEITKFVFARLMRGSISAEALERALESIDAATVPTSDPDIVLAMKEQGMLDAVSALVALGVEESEATKIADKANEEKAERLAEAAKAQAETVRGADDMNADPNAEGKLDKEASKNTDAKPTTEVPERGDAKKIGE